MPGTIIYQSFEDVAAQFRKYGAKGDGVANDTAAIVNAVNDALNKGHKIVTIPPATFLTDPITSLTGDMLVQGCGPRSGLKSRQGGHVIEITGGGIDASYLTIRDLAIIGAGQVGNAGHGIYFHDTSVAARHLLFQNLRISQCGGSGIRLGSDATEQNTVFSSMFDNIHLSACGDDLFHAKQIRPTCVLRNIYPEAPLVGKWCFYVGNGHFQMIGCNGQDNDLAVAGGGYAKFGDIGKVIAHIIACNVEGWHGRAFDLSGQNSHFIFTACTWLNYASYGPDGPAGAGRCTAIYAHGVGYPIVLDNCVVDPKPDEEPNLWLDNCPLHSPDGAPFIQRAGQPIRYFIDGDREVAAYTESAFLNSYDGVMQTLTGVVSAYGPISHAAGYFANGGIAATPRRYFRGKGSARIWPDGNYNKGDVLFYDDAAPGGYVGEVCTYAGSVVLSAPANGFLASRFGAIEADTLLASPLSLTPDIWLDLDDSTTLSVNSDGSGGVPADGGTIGRITDKSGNGRHFYQPTAGNRLTRQASSLNGKGGMVSIPANSTFMSGVVAYPLPAKYTIMIVYSGYGAASTGSLYGDAAAGNNTPLQFDTLTAPAANSPSAYFQYAALSARNLWLERCNFTDSRYEIRQNNVAGSSVITPAGLATTANLIIGRGYGPTSLTGKIHEVVLIPRIATDREFDQLRAYAANKWGFIA